MSAQYFSANFSIMRSIFCAYALKRSAPLLVRHPKHAEPLNRSSCCMLCSLSVIRSSLAKPHQEGGRRTRSGVGIHQGTGAEKHRADSHWSAKMTFIPSAHSQSCPLKSNSLTIACRVFLLKALSSASSSHKRCKTSPHQGNHQWLSCRGLTRPEWLPLWSPKHP